MTQETQGFFVLFGLIIFFLALVIGFIAWVALRKDPYDKAEHEKERLLASADRELERRPVLNS